MMFAEALRHPLALECRLSNSFTSNNSWFPSTETSGPHLSLIWIQKWFKIQAKQAHMAGLEPPRPTQGGCWMSFFAKCLPIVNHDDVFSVHNLNSISLWVQKLSISFAYFFCFNILRISYISLVFASFLYVFIYRNSSQPFSSPFAMLIPAT